MKKLLFILCLISAYQNIGHCQGFMAKPLKVEVSLSPGKVYNTIVEFQNTTSNINVPLRFDIMDLYQSVTGSWSVEKGETENTRSCKEWLSLESNNQVLPPLSQFNLNITINIPPSRKGLYSAALVAQTIGNSQDSNNAGLSIVLRFIIPILVEVKGPAAKKDIVLTDIALITMNEDSKSYESSVLTFLNKGETKSRVSGKMFLFKKTNERWMRVYETNMNNKTILPGFSISLSQEIPRRLPTGIYKIDASPMVDGKSVRPISKEINFTGVSVINNIGSEMSLNFKEKQIEIKGNKKSLRNYPLSINNPNDEDLEIVLEATTPKVLETSYLNDLKGSIYSCSKWIKFPSNKIKIAANTTKNIPLQILFPDENNLNTYYFSTIKVYAYDKSNTNTYTDELLLIAHNITGAPNQSIISKNMTLSKEEGNNYFIVSNFINNGNTHVKATCKSYLSDTTKTKKIMDIEIEERDNIIFPLQNFEFGGNINFSNINEGVYIIISDLIYEKKQETQILPIHVTDSPSGEKVVEVIDLTKDEKITGDADIQETNSASSNSQPGGTPLDGTQTAQVK